jgi:hypothetical protein
MQGRPENASHWTGPIRPRRAGFEVLLGRSTDLVGAELPYQPFAEALRPVGRPWQADRQTPGSQPRVFILWVQEMMPGRLGSVVVAQQWP